MLSFDFGFVCIFIGFAHLTESRVLILSEYGDDPLTLDHIEKTSQEDVQTRPIFPEPKQTRNSKRTVIQFGGHIYHLDTRELRSKINRESISYDYVDVDKLMKSLNPAKDGVRNNLKDLFILSPVRLCYEGQCKDNLRKSSKKHKKHDNGDDDIDWKHKKMQLPLGHIKRFQIVDNKHNSVRNSKFGSGENEGKKKGKKKAKKHKKYSSGSDESKESGSEEKNNGKAHKKKKRKVENSDESENIEHEDSASASFEKWKNHEESSKSDEDIPKKKTKKKKKKHTEEPEDTERKTMPVEETYFMQGNKIYHSNGKSKKKHDNFDKRRRLEHFMPKRYHWDPSDIHDLGYYWFNGPKGLYPEPKPLSI